MNAVNSETGEIIEGAKPAGEPGGLKMSKDPSKIMGPLMKAVAAMPAIVELDERNPFHNSDFASMKSIIKSSRDPLLANGILSLSWAEPCDGDLYRIHTRLMHESGEWIEISMPMHVPGGDMQKMGGALTYGRRYNAFSLFYQFGGKDDDGRSSVGNQSQDAQSSYGAPTANQLKYANDLAAKHGIALPPDASSSRSACKAFIDKYKDRAVAGATQQASAPAQQAAPQPQAQAQPQPQPQQATQAAPTAQASASAGGPQPAPTAAPFAAPAAGSGGSELFTEKESLGRPVNSAEDLGEYAALCVKNLREATPEFRQQAIDFISRESRIKREEAVFLVDQIGKDLVAA